MNEGKAIITAPEGYTCCPDGYTVVRYLQGQEVAGEVAAWAIVAGAAMRIKDVGETSPENKAVRPPMVKRGKRRE